MIVRYFLRICYIVCALAVSSMAGAAVGSVSAEIDTFMAAYTHTLIQQLGTGARIDYSVPPITNADTRSCATPLAISAKDQSSSLNRVMLFVACGKAWSIYVPVDLDVYRAVVIAVRPLANGTVVAADDVELSQTNVSQLVGTYLTALNDAIGMGVKRPIAQGRPVIAQQLEPPLLIRRGDAVVISAETGSLAVSMTGTAMTDGHRGEQIRIKNQATSRIVDARVVAPGHVTVPM